MSHDPNDRGMILISVDKNKLYTMNSILYNFVNSSHSANSAFFETQNAIRAIYEFFSTAQIIG